MRTPLTRLLTLATVLAFAGCSGEAAPNTDAPVSPSSQAVSPTTTAASPPQSETPAAGTVIEIAIEGDSIDPNGERVQVPLGEPVILAITADRPGELHVHSSPEEEVEFNRGDTEVELTFDKPGVVEVEDHESGKVIVQLQVS